jgi:hypothetical protein
MKKWQIALIALFLIGLVVTVFGAMPDSHSARAQKSAERYRQLEACAFDPTVKGDVRNFSDGAEPSGILGYPRVTYPYENHRTGPFAAGSRYADYQGVFGSQWDVLTLEIVRRDDCSRQQRSSGKELRKNGDDFVIRVAEFSSLASRN